MAEATGTAASWPAVLAAVGAALTTFLLVNVPVAELLDLEFSALVALPLGLLAGLGALLAVVLGVGPLAPAGRRAVSAYASFGPAVVLVLALAYVNAGRAVLTPGVAAGAGLAATAIVYVALGVLEREAS